MKLELDISVEEYEEAKGKACLEDPKYDWSEKETDLRGDDK